MNPKEQVAILTKTDVESFQQKIAPLGHKPFNADSVSIFQMNVGKLCNLTCKHCHVAAGPDRTENMTKETFKTCLAIIKQANITTVDLTGGAPEMNPNLEWFMNELGALNKRIIVRSNLVILTVPKYAHFVDVFTKNKVEVAASLPYYNEAQTDLQRGNTVFKKSIKALNLLNDKGYGKEGSGLVLDLVHNPVGAYLPGNQTTLEKLYKQKLKQDFNIDFNHLFCITNLPISRYLEYLIESENYEDYMEELVNAFNPHAVDNVMCKNTISVGWDGQLYDCDFNQMLELPLGFNAPTHIDNYKETLINNRRIVLNNHCYGCTAGAGSSCQGTIT